MLNLGNYVIDQLQLLDYNIMNYLRNVLQGGEVDTTAVLVNPPVLRSKNVKFDPEEEIGDELWDKIVTDFKEWQPTAFMRRKMAVLQNMAILFPDRMEFARPNNSLCLYEICEEINRNIAQMNLDCLVLAEMFCQRKLIFGEKNLPSYREEWEDLLAYFQNKVLRLNKTEWANFLSYTVNLKVYFNKLLDKQLDQTLFQKIVKEALGEEDLIMHTVNYLRNARILFPEFFKRIKISDKMWNRIFGYFDWLRSGGVESVKSFVWFDFVEMAAAMKIICAEEISVSEKGLEIEVMRKSLDNFEEPVLQMPQVRKFLTNL